MNGMPVMPTRPTTASGLSTSLLPPNANCTSDHCTPASVHAARMASAPISSADLGPKRPNGCSPTPMMATSSMSIPLGRPEGVGHDLGAVLVGPEGDDDELEVHADAQLGGVGDGEPTLDAHVVAELDDADAVGLERLGRLAARVGLLREEVLRRVRPERALAGQQVALHPQVPAAGTAALLREG